MSTISATDGMPLGRFDGTLVLDIKPWFAEFGPCGEVHQAPGTTEMLGDYFASPPPDRCRSRR